MKLPLLLAQFLYKTKKLSLPGIGVFTLDPAAVIPDGHGKNQHAIVEGIEFSNETVVKPDEALIEFIRSSTGKIRPVAISDLESFLSLGTELLNIGKPFQLEGIGAITKNPEGNFSFSPGEYSVMRQDESTDKAEKGGKRKSILEEAQYEPPPNSNRRVLVFVAIVIGLAVIGWGGYMMYKKNAPGENKTDINEVRTDTATSKTDSTALIAAAADSAARQQQADSLRAMKDSSMYKFIILETYNKEHALKRYNQLLSYDLKIKMFNKDSAYFKLYFRFRAAPKDTVHIKDSLMREYAHRVIIEK